MLRASLALLVATLYVLHQDFWFWRQARPLLFGFVPVGLLYHVLYTLAVSFMMWVLVRYAWPSHLEPDGNAGNRVPPPTRACTGPATARPDPLVAPRSSPCSPP